ncbi:MAG: hypothetical protein AAB803_02520, partial [Patescibacteria group bacterium]
MGPKNIETGRRRSRVRAVAIAGLFATLSPMQCHICKNATAEMFLDLGLQPLANKYPRETDFASEDFFPMKVFFCTTCKNVQLGTIVSRERMFEDYYYLSSVN